MNKIYLYIIIFLLSSLIGTGVFVYIKTNELKDEISVLKEEKKQELKRVRDSAFVKIDTIIKRSNKRFDSILNLPPKTIWKPYEKPVYIDRSLNDALRIHAEYKANQRSTRIN